ncbi:MAG: peptide deformylase [Candidatus Moranbacteria bacterium RBG_19FT_COMBO_42_6]|nr:MAG: peptide deformylase [Candidatus Moranbacteria bacterium RBG_19FT_COMBO_42_6]
MAILPIRLYPDPILTKKAGKIQNAKNPEIQELILDMLETMEKNDGLGLAASQVGVSLRLCVINLDGKKYILINPKFKSRSWKKVVAEEGCLSFPGFFIPVKRHNAVIVKALDRSGKEIIIKAEGMLSRVLQHEIDHLEGIPFTKRKAKAAASDSSSRFGEVGEKNNNIKKIWKKAL